MGAGFFLLAILTYLGTVGFLYTSEIFPTRIRGACLGIATSTFRVCNVVLPLVVVALTPIGIGYAVTGTIAVLLVAVAFAARSEEHTSELQSLMRISYAVFCLKKKNEHTTTTLSHKSTTTRQLNALNHNTLK